MLFPFALYWIRNSPCQMELSPFKIIYDIPAPIVPSLHSAAIAELKVDDLIFRVRVTEWAHTQVWPKLYALYKAGLVLEPHKFQPGDWVYESRFHQGVLEPR